MQYRFTEDEDWSDYASGHVLRSRPGQTAFPVRLANEIYRWCTHLCEEQGSREPYAVYDPCCGGGYLATVLGLLNANSIRSIIVSDIDSNAVSLAQQNLALLSKQGLQNRIAELKNAIESHGKASHRDALASALRLADLQVDMKHVVFCANVTRLQSGELKKLNDVDIVLADIPYGRQSFWIEAEGDPVQAMLTSLLNLPRLRAIGIASAKKISTQHDSYRRIKKFSAGHRQISILLPTSSDNH